MEKAHPTSCLCKDYLGAKAFTAGQGKKEYFSPPKWNKLSKQLVQKLTLCCKFLCTVTFKDPTVLARTLPRTPQWTKSIEGSHAAFSSALFLE